MLFALARVEHGRHFLLLGRGVFPSLIVLIPTPSVGHEFQAGSVKETNKEERGLWIQHSRAI